MLLLLNSTDVILTFVFRTTLYTVVFRIPLRFRISTLVLMIVTNGRKRRDYYDLKFQAIQPLTSVINVK